MEHISKRIWSWMKKSHHPPAENLLDGTHERPGGYQMCFRIWENSNGLNLGCALPRIPVTTKIIMFLVGGPNLNLHLPLASWEGGQPKFKHK